MSRDREKMTEKIEFTGDPGLLKWARRAARMSRRHVIQMLGGFPFSANWLRSVEKSESKICWEDIGELACIYKRSSAAFLLRRVPRRWYFEWLGLPRYYEGKRVKY